MHQWVEFVETVIKKKRKKRAKLKVEQAVTQARAPKLFPYNVLKRSTGSLHWTN